MAAAVGREKREREGDEESDIVTNNTNCRTLTSTSISAILSLLIIISCHLYRFVMHFHQHHCASSLCLSGAEDTEFSLGKRRTEDGQTVCYDRFSGDTRQSVALSRATRDEAVSDDVYRRFIPMASKLPTNRRRIYFQGNDNASPMDLPSNPCGMDYQRYREFILFIPNTYRTCEYTVEIATS